MLIKNQPISKATHIAFVLDCSSSMEPIKGKTIELFNSQLSLHRTLSSQNGAGDVTFSFYKFNDKVMPICKEASFNDIQGVLEPWEYTCAGSTALNDAIIKAIDDLASYPIADNQGYLVIILSDGEENSSKYRDSARLGARIRELKNSGLWTFEFIGSDGSGLLQATNLGFSSTKFEHSLNGVSNLSSKLNSGISTYYAARSVGATSCSLFAGETPSSEMLEEASKKLSGQ